jgi:lipopolysaccharide export system permease protein
MMFFIGAPLGAIIRKGGLGLPIIFAVLIFTFHFINTFGKKIAQENGMSPFMGGVDVVIYPVTTSYIVNLSRNK